MSEREFGFEKLTDIGTVRAERLREEGFRTVEDIRDASVNNLTEVPGISDRLAAQMKEEVREMTSVDRSDSGSVAADLTHSTDLMLGTERQDVQELQERLAERGYDVGPIDGEFGPRTREAVAELQREHELSASGVVTAETGDVLDLDVDVPEVEEERAKFKQFLMRNPNYFGNRPTFDYEPVVELVEDTSYEELTCVGYDPGTSQLEAVINIKRSVGYGGDVCTEGSVEFVRFFIDRDRNGDWEDVGVASTKVYDIPGEKPVSYAVSIELEQELETCGSAVLPRVRAILSWETEPPANEDYRPVWGDRHEADIQLEPRPPVLGDLIDEDLVDPDTLSGVDLDASAAFEPPKMKVNQLLAKYEGTSVPDSRAGFDKFKKLLSGPAPQGLSGVSGPIGPDGPDGPLDPDMPIPPAPFPEPIPDLGPEFDLPPDFDIDTEDLAEDLFETTGETSYEELDCVGFRQGVLTGVLTLKQSAGYSGGFCTAGSPEYVAFWEKPIGGGTWTHIGTGSVTVHDIPSLPGEGLEYAVHLPADLSHHRKPCDEGASLVKVRAVLSWNRKPPSTDPSFTPTWGNRVETVVQVPSGPEADEGILEVGTIGNVVPFDIEQPEGFADGTLVSSGGSVDADEAPFGGRVTITGRPAGFSPSASGPKSLKYRIMVKPDSAPESAYQPLTNKLEIPTYADPGDPEHVTVDDDGYYTYVPGAKLNLLAVWHTSDDGLYNLKIEAKRGTGEEVDAAAVTYPDGTTEDEMKILLDNTSPEASINITGVERGGSGSVEEAGECDFFNVGDTVVGTFTAKDKHLRSYGLVVRPSDPAGGAVVRETSSTRVIERGGDEGEWNLETDWSTGEMADCGYIVRVTVTDNTIVNNNYHGHRSHDSEGFCLLPRGAVVEEPEENGPE